MAKSKFAERYEPVDVDINDTGLAEGVEQEQDLREDWQARACPPPKARYRMRCYIADDTFEQNTKRGFTKDDPNGKFYTKQVELHIQDPSAKWQDSIVYYR